MLVSERDEIQYLPMNILASRADMLEREADMEQYRAERARERAELGLIAIGPDGSWAEIAKFRQGMADGRRANAKIYRAEIAAREGRM